jgi:hypothetical protein
VMLASDGTFAVSRVAGSTSKAPTRFELVQTAPRPISRDLGGLLLRLREAFANAV